jgi:hypothetical protein
MCEIETSRPSQQSGGQLYELLEHTIRGVLGWDHIWELADEPPKATAKPPHNIFKELLCLIMDRIQVKEAEAPRACSGEAAD